MGEVEAAENEVVGALGAEAGGAFGNFNRRAGVVRGLEMKMEEVVCFICKKAAFF